MTAGLPRYRSRLVHLTAVWAYGVSQPVFALIDGNPELLLSRGLSRFEIVVFAVLLAVVPPLLAVGYAWLAGRVSTWVGDIVYLVLLGAGLVPLATRLLKPLDTGLLVAAVLVAALAVAGVVAYARWRAARLFLGYSIVVPIAGLLWFVNGLPSLTDEAKAAQVRATSPAPVVFLLLDELPASSLMTRSGGIDAVRYPSFARLARQSTWYRNATTAHEWTSDAAPSIVTGRVIHSSKLATADSYPENLFTLLGGSYELRVHESYATRLCPEELCPRESRSSLRSGLDLFVDSLRLWVTRSLPRSMSEEVVPVHYDVGLQAESRSSMRQFEAFLDEVSGMPRDNVLAYTHLLLPHAPWRYLPSGDEYDFHGMDGWRADEHWEDDPWPVLQGYQRHLLQLEYTDRQLGRLLRRLERRGLWDGALVVVVADHGASFRAGEGRRPLTADNLADIVNVPMFVKYPGQRRGRVDDRAARSVDLLPTIANVLGIRLPWETDGVSLLAAPVDRGVLVDQRGGEVERAPLEEMIRDRETTLRRKAAAFGEGADSMYRIGTHRWLLGRNVTGVRDGPSTVEVRLDAAARFLDVRPGSGFVPARISGRVTAGRLDPGAELAIAVNGRVQAVTRTLEGRAAGQFRALVPESAFRPGANEVEVFLVSGKAERASLVRVGST
jgi:sulfatase-like protein